MDIIQTIHTLYPEMTKKQKSIADCLLESPEDISYITLAQLSQRTSSSELTLLRFCQKVGCANFLELKNAFREYTQNMVKLLSSPQYFVPDATITDVEGKSELLRQVCREESEACKDFFSSLDLLSLISTAEAIRSSKRVFICAHNISHILAEFLEARLQLLYFDASLIDLDDLQDTENKLEQLTPEDLVIFIAFPKYYYPLGSIAKNAFSRGSTILTITDSMSSPTVQYSKYMLICHTATRVFYNSLTLPMALLNLLLSYLVIDLGPDYRSRDLNTPH
jgi:DNA-binding MurR/RpiR family transcriptional regulator